MASSKQDLWAAGHDETVEVNQRALIDKVLSRYSGEFTVFRELLQNSDDAGARSVEIRFQTKEYLSREKDGEPQSDEPTKQEVLPDLKTAVVHQWTFKNNGMVFREEDWNRLKKIAEGNPDEEKIGAFGVGFYSLFSVTEEPWVTSGGKWMNFYWKDKKDQLYARRGTIPPVDDVVDPWTVFQMTLREPGPIPPAFDFTRFLVSSITFMTHLSEVSVYFDDKRLVKLSKDSDMSKEVPMLKGLKGMSPQGMMNVKSIEKRPLHIDAEVVRWVYTVGSEKPSASSKNDTLKTVTNQASGFFSSLFAGLGTSSTPRRTPTPAPVAPKESINLLETNSSSVILTIFAANVDVQLDKKMTAELLRSTKKKPPSRLRYELIYTGKDEYDSSVKAEEKAAYATGSVFQGLRADLEGSGSARVFIGHSTGQTTGIGGHMATRFIPTVERESIDLVDRNVAVWNKELLYVGGFLARSAYELELDAIKKMWEGATAVKGPGSLPDEEVQTWLRGRALHALKFFTFHPSTPSPLVSNSMEAAFFICATTHPFSIISSEGVRSASEVHIPDPEFSGFLKRLPVISDDIVNGAKTMMATLRSRGMIKNITYVDVLNELRLRPLSETETIACLKWWIGVAKKGNNLNLSQGRSQLLDALVVSITGPPEKIMKLSDAQTFLNSRAGGAIIPTDGPLPSTLLPTSITRSFDPDVLVSVFPWKQLSIVDWLRHVTDPKVAGVNAEFNVTLSAPWAERVLSVLARAWPSLAKSAQEDVIQILSPKSCIPTSIGLKKPDQAYFSSVNMFRDLPIVTMQSGAVVKGALEKVLQSLGVRKHVELQIIFDRMIKTGDWTTYDLVKYLVSVQSTLTTQELERLQQTSAFPKEGAGKEQLTTGPTRKAQRHKAMDLYEPVDIFRELRLPIIDWGADNRWKPTSDEAKFIFSLGLRRAPPLPDILRIAASEDPTVRMKALAFFLDKVSVKYSDYDPHDFRDLAFVPAVRGSEKVLEKPLELYAGPEWAALGFAVVDPQLPDGAVVKLKLKSHPPTSELVTLLERSPPEDEAIARQWFEVLSGRVPDFSSAELRRLSETPFVPVKSIGDKSVIRRLQPIQCYFSGTGGGSELHSKLFAFVNFGARANLFLGTCGTKQEPSVEEIAQILLADPRGIYELASGRENYLIELRNLAVNKRLLSKATITRMKRSNVLLGYRRVKKDGSKTSSEGDEDDWDLQDQLLQPSKVAIADDTNTYQLFGDRIFCAPQEDILEELYLSLGSPRLSTLVKEKYETSREEPHSRLGPDIRHLILERLPLFLHEHPQSRTKVSFNWLNEEKNFIVKVFGKLVVTKSLHHGDIRNSEKHEAFAVAKREGKGPIELWLAGNTQVDMYEVSTSLCRFIFESPKVNDALLFMTILSTDLKALKRRGYNVDRILRQQKAERDAAEKARAETRTLLISKPPEKTVQDTPANIPTTQTKIPPPPTNTATIAPLPTPPSATPESTGLDQTPKRSRPSSAIHELGRLLRPNRSEASSSRPTSPPKGEDVLPPSKPTPSGRDVSPPPNANVPEEAPLSSKPGSPRPIIRPQPRQQGAGITPLSNITNNINMAIKACTAEKSNLLKNREDMQMVKESLDEGYCDVSGRAGELDFVGSMGGVKVFAGPELPERQTLIQRKHDVLARFLHILNPLVDVYKIPQTSLHVFADSEGQLVAFNRNGSLFMNLRYFEAWHDRDVQRRDYTKAMISWYFTLAHEIAHNLVHPHNSEHEFYFSAICEAYLVPLSKLLPDS